MMTLPNRSTYIAERKAEGGEHAYQKGQEGSHSGYIQPNNGFPFHPPSLDHKHPSELSKSASHDHHDDGLRNGASKSGSVNNNNNSIGSTNTTTTTTTTTSSSSNNNNNNSQLQPYDSYRNTVCNNTCSR